MVVFSNLFPSRVSSLLMMSLLFSALSDESPTLLSHNISYPEASKLNYPRIMLPISYNVGAGVIRYTIIVLQNEVHQIHRIVARYCWIGVADDKTCSYITQLALQQFQEHKLNDSTWRGLICLDGLDESSCIATINHALKQRPNYDTPHEEYLNGATEGLGRVAFGHLDMIREVLTDQACIHEDAMESLRSFQLKSSRETDKNNLPNSYLIHDQDEYSHATVQESLRTTTTSGINIDTCRTVALVPCNSRYWVPGRWQIRPAVANREYDKLQNKRHDWPGMLSQYDAVFKCSRGNECTLSHNIIDESSVSIYNRSWVHLFRSNSVDIVCQNSSNLYCVNISEYGIDFNSETIHLIIENINLFINSNKEVLFSSLNISCGGCEWSFLDELLNKLNDWTSLCTVSINFELPHRVKDVLKMSRFFSEYIENRRFRLSYRQKHRCPAHLSSQAHVSLILLGFQTDICAYSVVLESSSCVHTERKAVTSFLDPESSLESYRDNFMHVVNSNVKAVIYSSSSASVFHTQATVHILHSAGFVDVITCSTLQISAEPSAKEFAPLNIDLFDVLIFLCSDEECLSGNSLIQRRISDSNISQQNPRVIIISDFYPNNETSNIKNILYMSDFFKRDSYNDIFGPSQRLFPILKTKFEDITYDHNSVSGCRGISLILLTQCIDEDYKKLIVDIEQFLQLCGENKVYYNSCLSDMFRTLKSPYTSQLEIIRESFNIPNISCDKFDVPGLVLSWVPFHVYAGRADRAVVAHESIMHSISCSVPLVIPRALCDYFDLNYFISSGSILGYQTSIITDIWWFEVDVDLMTQSISSFLYVSDIQNKINLHTILYNRH